MFQSGFAFTIVRAAKGGFILRKHVIGYTIRLKGSSLVSTVGWGPNPGLDSCWAWSVLASTRMIKALVSCGGICSAESVFSVTVISI